MKSILPLFALLLLTQCSTPESQTSGSGSVPMVARGGFQEIINVSAYDPKERQRKGRSYSQHDVSALRANGAKGLIARAGKGGKLDDKCVAFLNSADKAGLLPGIYYRVQKHVSPERQADQFVRRAQALARMRSWSAPSLLLCGDYDGDLPLSSILRFMDRVEQRTGVIPVSYLENSQQLKLQTRAADRRTKSRLARAPYWLALYSHTSGDGPVFPAPGTPRNLVKQYDLWPTWTMWQYGGVSWENGRSRPKVYNHGRYRFSPYFGSMDRPLERNIFRGSQAQLVNFWGRHGLPLR